jgi:hypothetical protein
MNLTALLRSRIKAARKRNAAWVRALDIARLLPTGAGRARLWTRVVHGAEVHQTTPYTAEDRYPALFDLAFELAPNAARILSFGCSTGEELVALRRRFASAEILGAEINPRSRRIAARRVADDRRTRIVGPRAIEGTFDLIFALAVLQREPHRVEETGSDDLSSSYPFARFDAAVTELVARLNPGGLLCVMHAHYRVEDSSAAAGLEPVDKSPVMDGTLFGRDGRRIRETTGQSIFRKRGQGGRRGCGRSKRRSASRAR